MRKGCFYFFLTAISMMWVSSCIEPYDPPVSDEEVDYLVVDGAANSTDGTAEIKLSRTVSLSSTETPPPERNAVVAIEDNEGNSYTLAEAGEGFYRQSNLSFDFSKQYRLYIKTTGGSEYRSDFVKLKPTPPIDSITWARSRTEQGIDLLVNTHDDTNSTRYYQWSFEETFEYEAVYNSYLQYVNGEVIEIPASNRTFLCWRTIPSQGILVGSSERLSQDVISDFLLTSIPKGDQKLLIKYSILVKQKAISREAYDYWTTLQQATESLGGLFDPQPGRVTGNIVNINNPSDLALGYFDIGDIQEKRKFIRSGDLPRDLWGYKDVSSCEVGTILLADLPNFVQGVLLDPLSAMGILYGYSYTSFFCTDCRLQGGVTTKPDFWE